MNLIQLTPPLRQLAVFLNDKSPRIGPRNDGNWFSTVENKRLENSMFLIILPSHLIHCYCFSYLINSFLSYHSCCNFMHFLMGEFKFNPLFVSCALWGRAFTRRALEIPLRLSTRFNLGLGSALRKKRKENTA